MRRERLLIAGGLRDAGDGRSFPSLNPATGEVVGSAPDASGADADVAVRAARRALTNGEWAVDRRLRADRLRAFATVLEENKESLRADLVAEGGVPIRLTRSIQLDAVFDELDWICHRLAARPTVVDLAARDFHGFASRRMERRVPCGVVTVLTPANFPVAIPLKRVFTALAAGNTVVLKPSPDTPLAALSIARLAPRAGLPPGVLNVVTTTDDSVAAALCQHKGVDLVSLTGSSATGRLVGQLAAERLKRAVLYLGGKSAHVVLDADVETIAAIGRRVCFHAGQSCTLFSRLLLPRRMYDEGIEILREAMSTVPSGSPDDEDVVMGPLVSEAAWRRFRTAVAAVPAAGGSVVCGGEGTARRGKGFFVPPTLLTGLSPGSHLAREETPGPLLIVFSYDTEAQALEIANSVDFGLAAAVTAESADRAEKFAAGLRAAAISVNDGLPYGPDSPYSAFGASGNGHNGGDPALDDYIVRQVIGSPAQ